MENLIGTLGFTEKKNAQKKRIFEMMLVIRKIIIEDYNIMTENEKETVFLDLHKIKNFLLGCRITTFKDKKED
jgi:hypothetical protein